MTCYFVHILACCMCTFINREKKLMRPRLSYREEFSCVHLNFSGTTIEKCVCLKNGYVIICLLSEKRMM